MITAGKAGRENDMSIVPMDLTNSKFDQLGLYQFFRSVANVIKLFTAVSYDFS
jgi:hypothetical protein